MIWVRAIVGLLITLFVIGGGVAVCLQVAGVLKFTPPSAPGLSVEEAGALSQVYADIIEGRGDAVAARFVEGVDRESAQAEIARFRQVLPSTPPESSRLMRWSKHQSAEQMLAGAHEYIYADRVVLVQTELARADGSAPWLVRNFNFNSATHDELAANRFTLSGKSPTFIGVVAAAFLIPVFVWGTAMAALVISAFKRRWLWLLFIIATFSTLSLNTTTQEMSFAPLSIQLFGASAFWSGSTFEPWVIGVSLPVGALAFWLVRPWRTRRTVGEETTGAEPSS